MQVNLLLDNVPIAGAPATDWSLDVDLDGSSPLNDSNVVGFVFVRDKCVSAVGLQELREAVKKQFDKAQLSVLSDDKYSFVKRGVSVSHKQEDFLSLSDVALVPQSLIFGTGTRGSNGSDATPIPGHIEDDRSAYQRGMPMAVMSSASVPDLEAVIDDVEAVIDKAIIDDSVIDEYIIDEKQSVPTSAFMTPQLISAPNFEQVPHHLVAESLHSATPAQVVLDGVFDFAHLRGASGTRKGSFIIASTGGIPLVPITKAMAGGIPETGFVVTVLVRLDTRIEDDMRLLKEAGKSKTSLSAYKSAAIGDTQSAPVSPILKSTGSLVQLQSSRSLLHGLQGRDVSAAEVAKKRFGGRQFASEMDLFTPRTKPKRKKRRAHIGLRFKMDDDSSSSSSSSLSLAREKPAVDSPQTRMPDGVPTINAAKSCRFGESKREPRPELMDLMSPSVLADDPSEVFSPVRTRIVHTASVKKKGTEKKTFLSDQRTTPKALMAAMPSPALSVTTPEGIDIKNVFKSEKTTDKKSWFKRNVTSRLLAGLGVSGGDTTMVSKIKTASSLPLPLTGDVFINADDGISIAMPGDGNGDMDTPTYFVENTRDAAPTLSKVATGDIFDSYSETNGDLSNVYLGSTGDWVDAARSVPTSVKPKFIILGPPPPAGSSARYTVLRDADALIATLSGMRHTARHPIWVDASCDGLLFEEIAAHIRPRIHPLTVEDCIAADCREKQEIFDHYLFMCIRASHSGVRVAIIVFKTIIITYHCGECDIMDGTREALVKRHFPSLTRSKWLCPGPGWVTHAIIDAVVDALIPEVNRVVREVRNVEQLVFMLSVDSQSELLSRIQMARVSLALYRHRLWPKSTLTYNLNNKMWRAFLQHVPAPYWRDVNDHVSRMVDSLQLSLQTLETLQNVFVAKVSLDMARNGNRLAAVAGTMGAVGAVFLPMTVVTGMWGMNCWVPFQQNLSSAMFYPKEYEFLGFVGALLVMAVLSTLSLAFVKYKGYMQPNREWVDPM